MAMEQLIFLVLACIGTIRIVTMAIQLVEAVWIMFLRPAKDLTEYGSWALVTGASDGIGRAFCFEVAKRNINVLMVGRSESKLQDLAKELQNIHGVSAKFVVVDFADDDLEAGISRIEKELEGLDVGLLINNVGVSYPYARFFHEVDRSLLENLLRVNIKATTRMSQLLLPGMLKRRKGAIVNIGSASGTILQADPLYSVYAASKGYIEILSRSMHVEYKPSGIDVQCQAPLYVMTKLAKIRSTSLTVPSPQAYARAALKSIGYEPVCSPYWAHYILWCLMSLVPDFIVGAVRLRSNIDLRRRGQLKDAKIKGN